MKTTDLLLSYLIPVTIEVTSSEWNPVLEVTLNGGRFQLNSNNTNYSYGSLHSLFKKTFRKLKPDWMSINNALILGFGTGCVAETILKYNPDCKIDGVEIDSVIIELGKKYFNTHLFRNLTVHYADAAHFLENSSKKYDLVVIDVYVDINVPHEVETAEFLNKVKESLKTGGLVIFNKFIYSKSTKEQIPTLKELFERTFGNLKILTVMLSGKIFISGKEG